MFRAFCGNAVYPNAAGCCFEFPTGPLFAAYQTEYGKNGEESLRSDQFDANIQSVEFPDPGAEYQTTGDPASNSRALVSLGEDGRDLVARSGNDGGK